MSQVIVNGFVDGRPEAKDKTYTVHPETVAEQFWYLHQNSYRNRMFRNIKQQ
nr:short-chain dehydrogenase [Acinetobacter baumannii]